jgi:hypothetical protein
MAVTLSVNGGAKANITTYSVTEDSTSIDPTDSSGGVGQVNVSIAEETVISLSQVREVQETNIVINPSMEASSNTYVTTRTNLITNPSFEGGNSSPSNWYANSCTILTSFTQMYIGTVSVRVNATSAASNIEATPRSVVSPSTAYTFSVYVKGVAGKLIGLSISEYYSGTKIGTDSESLNNTMTGDWQRLSVTRTMGVNAETAALKVWNDTADAHVFFVDAAMFEAGSSASSYFDSTTIASGDYSYSLDSIYSTQTSHSMVISIERGKSVISVTGANAAAYQSIEWASTGTKSLRVTPTGISNLSMGTVTVPTTVGTVYTVQSKIRLSAALTGTLNAASRMIKVYTPAPSSLLSSSAQAANSAGVTTLYTTFTAATTSTMIQLLNGASVGNGEVWFDDLSVVASSSLNTYFDGSTTDNTENAYSWKNPTLANLSASTRSTITNSTVRTSLSPLFINDPILISDSANGSIRGIINSVNTDQLVTALSGDSLAKKLVATIDAGPFRGTLTGAFVYYMSLGAITSTSDYSIDQSFDYVQVAFQGFSGDLWTYVKNLCVVYSAEISLVSDKLVIRPIRQNTILMNKNITKSLSVKNNKLARSIEAYYYGGKSVYNSQVYPNNIAYPTAVEDATIWQYVSGSGYVEVPKPRTSLSTAQLMSVEANGYSEYEIALSASVFSLSRGSYFAGDSPAPISYSGIGLGNYLTYNPTTKDGGIILEPTDNNQNWVSNGYGTSGVSYYSVIGKNNIQITRTQWASDGGRVEVYITNNGNSLKFKIYGSKDSTGNGPFRLAYSDDVGDAYPYVNVKADAIQLDKQKVSIFTGVPYSKSVQEIGATIDNIFISSKGQAVSLGVVSAGNWCGPSREISVSTKSVANGSGLIEGQQILGNVAGARVRDGNAIYRVRSASITDSSTSYTAEADSLFEDINGVWGGKTFADFDTQFASKSFEDFGVIPLWRNPVAVVPPVASGVTIGAARTSLLPTTGWTQQAWMGDDDSFNFTFPSSFVWSMNSVSYNNAWFGTNGFITFGAGNGGNSPSTPWFGVVGLDLVNTSNGFITSGTTGGIPWMKLSSGSSEYYDGGGNTTWDLIMYRDSNGYQWLEFFQPNITVRTWTGEPTQATKQITATSASSVIFRYDLNGTNATYMGVGTIVIS